MFIMIVGRTQEFKKTSLEKWLKNPRVLKSGPPGMGGWGVASKMQVM
jgi:hypothetical protein